MTDMPILAALVPVVVLLALGIATAVLEQLGCDAMKIAACMQQLDERIAAKAALTPVAA